MKKMNTQIVIQARTGSTRFPNKVLEKIGKKNVIEIILHRLSKSVLSTGIVLITTNNPKDKKLIKIAKNNKIKYFAGSENNVLERYYFAAKKFKIDIIVRVTADCPLLSSDIIDKGIKIFLSKNIDYLHNTNHKFPYPDGFDIEIFSFKALERSFLKTKSYNNLEHVTRYLRLSSLFKKYQMICINNKLKKVKYSIDTKGEFTKIKSIFDYFDSYDFDFKDINQIKSINFINSLKS